MRKKYFIPQVDILAVESFALMTPASPPEDPHLAPKGHYVPGPGANYAPPAKII